MYLMRMWTYNIFENSGKDIVPKWLELHTYQKKGSGRIQRPANQLARKEGRSPYACG